MRPMVLSTSPRNSENTGASARLEAVWLVFEIPIMGLIMPRMGFLKD